MSLHGQAEEGWVGERGLRRGEAAEEAVEWLGDEGRYCHSDTPTGITAGATDVTVGVSPPLSSRSSRTVLGFHGGSREGDEGADAGSPASECGTRAADRYAALARVGFR